jgi:hypothetical protein
VRTGGKEVGAEVGISEMTCVDVIEKKGITFRGLSAFNGFYFLIPFVKALPTQIERWKCCAEKWKRKKVRKKCRDQERVSFNSNNGRDNKIV